MNTQENIYFNTNAAENYTDTSNQIHIPTLSNISQDQPPSTCNPENVRDSVFVVDDFTSVNHET